MTLITDVENTTDKRLTAYYNKQADAFEIINDHVQDNITARLYNVNGQLLKSVQINDTHTTISANSFSNGVYIIILTDKVVVKCVK